MSTGKKIFIFVLFLILIGFGIYEMKKNYSPLPTTPVDIDTLPPITGENSPSVETFSGSGFTFIYNKEIIAKDYNETSSWRTNTQTPGIFHVGVLIPKSFQPNTNFSNAKFTVGSSTDAQALKECLIPTNGERAKGETTINDVVFKKITLSEGAAGNYYDTTSYRTIRNNTCYAVEYTIHSTNLRNYDPGSVGEFDTQAVVQTLESMVQSFKFN